MPLVGIVAWLFAHKVHPDLARGPGEEGRRHRGGRRVRRRHRDGAGVRARGRRPQAASPSKASGVRDTVLRQAGVEAQHLPGPLLPPVALDRGGALLRRPRGDRRQSHLRRVRALHDAAAAARLAARVDGLDHQPRAARARLGGPQLRVARGHRDAARAERAQDAFRAGRIGVRLRGGSLRLRRQRASRLRGVDLEVEPGEVVAVCGGTGSGKTTLLNLLPRFYDPTAGRVLARRRRRARPLARRRCAATVAVVTQRPVLFSDPLRENLLGGRPDAAVGRRPRGRREAAGVDLVRRRPARRLRHADRRARREPLRRPAPARGARARADRRRARARARRPALGRRHPHRARARRRPAAGASQGRTVLLATQRLSTLELADRVVVLEDGRRRRGGHGPRSCSHATALFAALFGDEMPLPRNPPTGLRAAAPPPRGPPRPASRCCSARGRRRGAAQSGGWLLVRDGDQRRHRAKGDETFLALAIVGVYLVVQALGWALLAVLIRGMARSARRSCWACGASSSTT